MARKQSPDKMLFDQLASCDRAEIADALAQAQTLGWDVAKVRRTLVRFLGPLQGQMLLEEWANQDTTEVPGPRVELEDGPIPLVTVLAGWPALVPFLPWVPGPVAKFTVHHYVDLFHDLSEEELEEIEKRGPVWKRIRQTRSWSEAAKRLLAAYGSVSEQTLSLDTFFEEYEHLPESWKKQTAEAGVFIGGAHVEFEGNHNDAEFTTLVAKLVEPTPKKSKS